MKINRRTPLLLAAIFVVAAAGPAGCGSGGAGGQVWQHLLAIYHEHQDLLNTSTEPDEATRQQAHRMTAGSLQLVLDRHAHLPANLRKLLSQMRDRERELADGVISGSEAEAARQQHEEYWSYLLDRSLPPDFR